MEPKFQSSFIPKGPAAQTMIPGVKIKRKGKSFFGLIATLIFIVALLAAAGVFGYKIFLSRSIEAMGQDLEAARKTLDPETINELARLDARIISAEELLNNHTALSPLFDFLERSTLKNVRFTDFRFSADERGELILEMKGHARGYAAVALQSDIFNKAPHLKNQVFKGLDLDDKGNVIFTFSATVDPKLVAYTLPEMPDEPLVTLTGTTTSSTTGALPRSGTSTATTTNQPRR